jgi:hypothetical protein
MELYQFQKLCSIKWDDSIILHGEGWRGCNYDQHQRYSMEGLRKQVKPFDRTANIKTGFLQNIDSDQSIYKKAFNCWCVLIHRYICIHVCVCVCACVVRALQWRSMWEWNCSCTILDVSTRKEHPLARPPSSRTILVGAVILYQVCKFLSISHFSLNSSNVAYRSEISTVTWWC